MMTGFIQTCLIQLAEGASLTTDQAYDLFRQILSGAVDPTSLAAILTALHLRRETTEELVGAVRAMREAAIPLRHYAPEAVDVCGTGGDRLNTLNVSTAVAFVLAAMQIPVAKHGNRAVSSNSGATDVLSELGIHPDGNLDRQRQRLETQNLAFLAAPLHIPALGEIAETRRKLGFRTIFNMIGPACNPASVKRQMIGVSDPRWMVKLAETTGRLGGTRVTVIYGETDRGISDELTLSGISHLAVWRDGGVTEYTLDPTAFFGPHQKIATLAGGTPAQNARALMEMLESKKGVYRDTVCLNAAIALDVAGHGDVFIAGCLSHDALSQNMARVAKVIDEGHALAVMERARDINMLTA